MNDFGSIVLAFGRGIIKILISGLVGFGVALLVIGLTTSGRPDVWHRGEPPGELFVGIGAGLLSGGGTLLALFFLPMFVKRPAPPPAYLEEPPILARPAPRPPRYDRDEPARVPPKPRPEPDDSSAPLVRPAPPLEESGKEGFYEK